MYRRLAAAIVALTIGATLAGCAQTADQSAKHITPTSPVAVATPVSSPTASPTPTAFGVGCRGTATLPAGAVATTIGDVDGDGRADRSYHVTSGGALQWGILTAAGGRTSFRDTLAGPAAHRMWVATIGGTTVAVLSDGRSAVAGVYATCGLHPMVNAQNAAFTFDMQDLVGTGTGVGCEPIDGITTFGGYQATRASNGSVTVAFTPTIINPTTAHATSGTTVTIATNADATSAVVQRASMSECGDAAILAVEG